MSRISAFHREFNTRGERLRPSSDDGATESQVPGASSDNGSSSGVLAGKINDFTNSNALCAKDLIDSIDTLPISTDNG